MTLVSTSAYFRSLGSYNIPISRCFNHSFSTFSCVLSHTCPLTVGSRRLVRHMLGGVGALSAVGVSF